MELGRECERKREFESMRECERKRESLSASESVREKEGATTRRERNRRSAKKYGGRTSFRAGERRQIQRERE